MFCVPCSAADLRASASVSSIATLNWTGLYVSISPNLTEERNKNTVRVKCLQLFI